MHSLSKHLKSLWPILKETFDAWLDVNATRLGAALSYYSVFSLGPLLIITIAVAGFFFGEEAARGQIFNELQGIVGSGGAEAIQALVASARQPVSGAIASILSLITLFVGATGVVVQLKDAMNTIWGIKPKPGRSAKVFFKNYVISLTALFGLGFILMASLIFSSMLTAVGSFISSYLSIPETLLSIVNIFFSMVPITIFFTLMFKFLPDVDLRWSDVWLGAFGTALMFNLGKFVVAFYLGKQALDSTYGAASSIIVIMIWVYYLSQVLFFGAEFTRIYALHSGHRIKTTDDVEFDPNAQPTVAMQAKIKDPQTLQGSIV